MEQNKEQEREPKYFSTTLTDEENAMIEELSSLTGLTRATAVKLHLRQTLPAKINSLRAEKAASLNDTNPIQNGANSQGKNQ